jgi:hypothetical protein
MAFRNFFLALLPFPQTALNILQSRLGLVTFDYAQFPFYGVRRSSRSTDFDR